MMYLFQNLKLVVISDPWEIQYMKKDNLVMLLQFGIVKIVSNATPVHILVLIPLLDHFYLLKMKSKMHQKDFNPLKPKEKNNWKNIISL